MADFTLKRTVWLHNRPWKPGSEDALQAAGFTREQKAEQVKRGAIVVQPGVNLEPETPPAPDAAPEPVAEKEKAPKGKK